MTNKSPLYHLAQINVARMRQPLEDPSMQDFVAQLEPINALADESPGFVWRLQSGSGNAVYLRAYDDPLMLINLSVWEDLDTLTAYVYRSAHTAVMRDRKRWFEKMSAMHMALWWVPKGHLPDEGEGRRKLDQLNEHGPSDSVFTFKNSFAPPA